MPVTAVPLGLTLVCAWTIWRIGAPRRRRRSPGTARTPTGSPTASATGRSRSPTALFAVGLRRRRRWSPAPWPRRPPPRPRTGRGSCSGRWASCRLRRLPGARRRLRAAPRSGRRGPAAAVRAAARWRAGPAAVAAPSCCLALSSRRARRSTSAPPLNVLSQLDADAGGPRLLACSACSLLPNAVLFGGAYLLGPGFAVGAGTLVTPGAVVARPAADLPAAGGAARHRPDARRGRRAWWPGAAASPRSAVARAQRAPPDAALGRGRAPRLRAAGMLAGVAARPARPRSPAARSGRAGCATSAPLRPGRAAARDHRLRHRRPGRRARDDLVAAPRRRPARSPSAGRAGTRVDCPGRATAPPASSCSSPAPAPTCRPCSTPAPTRRTAPRSSPSAPTATGIEGLARAEPGRRADLRAAGARTSPPAPPGTARWPTRSRPTSPTWSCSAGFMKLVGAGVPRRFGGRIVNTHPALLPSFPGMHGPATRWRTASRSPAARCSSSTPASTPGRSSPRRAVRGRATTTPTSRCTSGSRSPSARCSSTPSAGWPARASPSPTGRSGSA